MKRLSFLICAIILSACCTKKYCEPEIRPEIKITFVDFNSNETSNIKLKVFDTKSNNLINNVSSLVSIKIDGNDIIIINNNFFEGELRDHYFIVEIGTRKDTINNIEYDLFSSTIKCNSCFPFGSEKVNVSDFENFSFSHNGSIISEQSMIIKK
jgi:hypothetical protein